MTRLPRIAPALGAFLLSVTLGFLAGPTAAHAASFDCAKARTPTEKAICADAAVSKLDSDLAAAFKTAAAFWPAGNWGTFIRREQREWLKNRDDTCKADPACLKRDYELRLRFLTKPYLKYMGRYVSGTCPHKGYYLDVTPTFPADGVSFDLYTCPNPKGNMYLQASGVVDANNEMRFDDAGCPRVLRFEQDSATLAGADTGRCAPIFSARSFKRNPAKSPYEAE